MCCLPQMARSLLLGSHEHSDSTSGMVITAGSRNREEVIATGYWPALGTGYWLPGTGRAGGTGYWPLGGWLGTGWLGGTGYWAGGRHWLLGRRGLPDLPDLILFAGLNMGVACSRRWYS